MSFSEKIYRILLRAYPCEYRRRYAEPMEQLFRDRLRNVKTWADFAAFWWQTLADWVSSVPARYWERTVQHQGILQLDASARRSIFFARFEASSFSRREITVEHLLLGILRSERSLLPPAACLEILSAIESNEPSGRRIPPTEDLPLSMQARSVIAVANEIARQSGRPIAPADLAQAIRREGKSLAADLLRRFGAQEC
jgi:hypothetical protein